MFFPPWTTVWFRGSHAKKEGRSITLLVDRVIDFLAAQAGEPGFAPVDIALQKMYYRCPSDG